MTSHRGSSVPLSGGGELFINRQGRTGWSVDVFAADWRIGDDPIYHAFYVEEEDATNDASCWAVWPV